MAACIAGYFVIGERERPDRRKPPRSLVAEVVSQPLQLHVGQVRLDANGVVVPLREIQLATEVAGRIIRQSETLRPGKAITQGEVLIELDPIEYELEVRRLRAQASQESAQQNSIDVGIANTNDLLALANQQVELAKSEQARVESLIKRGAASATESDAARRAALTAAAAVAQLVNQERDLQAQRETLTEQQALTSIAIERAQLDLARTKIVAPISGRVVSLAVEENSYVQAGTTFVTIEDTSSVEVRANLTANQMKWVWASGDNDTSQVTAQVIHQSDSRRYAWDAVFERIDGAGIDTATRTYPCLFRVERPVRSTENEDDGPSELRRGMFVTVGMALQPRRTLYKISEAAIRPGNRVWFDVAGKLAIESVEVVSRTHGNVIVSIEPANPMTTANDDLTTTASVIVSPLSDPIVGMAVQSNSQPVGVTAAVGNSAGSIRKAGS